MTATAAAVAPVVTFDAASHVYRVDGRRVPSVTQVLALAGLLDLSHVDPERLAAAAARGTAVHVATEYDDQGDLDDASLTETWRPYVDAYRTFRRESGFAPELIEHRLYEPTYRFCGTVDRVGVLRGQRVVLDLKTGPPQAQFALQLAAYQRALAPTVPVLRRYCLHLRADATYALVEHTDPSDWGVFAAACRVAHWRLAHDRRLRGDRA